MRIDAKLVCVIWEHFGIKENADQFYGDSREEPFANARSIFIFISYEAKVPIEVIAKYLGTNVSTTWSRLKSIREKVRLKNSNTLNDLVCIRENLLK
jgi:hypothetical protein